MTNPDIYEHIVVDATYGIPHSLPINKYHCISSQPINQPIHPQQTPLHLTTPREKEKKKKEKV